MILSEILGTLRDLANNHTQIEGFYTGLVEEHNDSLIQYPALRVSFPYQSLASQDDDVLTYTIDLTLLVNDVIENVGNDITGPSLYEVNTNFANQQDELNEINTDLVDENLLRERAISILAQYIQGLRLLEEEPEYFYVTDGWNIQSLERYGNDKVTGCRVTLSISVGNDYKCQSIANINDSVWLNPTINQLKLPDFKCPDCPDVFPTTCNELLNALSTVQLNTCILPTYNFADSVIQNSLSVQQVLDLSTWLLPQYDFSDPSVQGLLTVGQNSDLVDYLLPTIDFSDLIIQGLITVGQQSDLIDWLLPLLDFSNPAIQSLVTPTQQTDLSNWLCTPVAPIVQYSMLFDGSNEYIDMRANTQYNFTNLEAISGEAWVKSTNYAATQSIFSKRNAGTFAGYIFAFVGGNLSINLSGGVGNNIYVVTNGFTFTNNTWYNVAFTYDGSGNASGVKLYVNGVSVAVTIVANTLSGTLANPNTLLIAADWIAAIYFQGYIGYIRLWREEKSAGDILTEYNSGVMLDDIDLTNCVVDWRSGTNALFGIVWAFPDATGINNPSSGYSVNMEVIDRTTDIP